MRSPLPWIGTVTAALLAGLLAEGLRVTPTKTTLAQEIHRQTPANNAGDLEAGVSGAAVLLQLADCTGNLRMVDLLNLRAAREGIALRVIWFTGPAKDSTRIRSLLPSFAKGTPLVAASKHVIALLAELGHTTTPSLVVLDPFGRVRFASQAPRSPREFAALRSIIEGLSWNEEH